MSIIGYGILLGWLAEFLVYLIMFGLLILGLVGFVATRICSVVKGWFK